MKHKPLHFNLDRINSDPKLNEYYDRVITGIAFNLTSVGNCLQSALEELGINEEQHVGLNDNSDN